MLAEALKQLEELALKGGDNRPLRIMNFPDDRNLYYDLQNGQPPLVVPVPPGVRKHQVDSVHDFINAALRAVGGHWHGVAAPYPVVWHDHGSLTLILDDTGDRRDRITMDLLTSREFVVLAGLMDKGVMNQLDLLQLLRIDLAKCVVDGPTIVGKIRQVKFTNNETMGANIQRGNESLDLDVRKEVAGIDDVPEFVQVTFPVYANPGERDREQLVSVMCALDPRIAEKKFVFRPLPGELDIAMQQAQSSIRRRLDDALPGVPIFHGRV